MPYMILVFVHLLAAAMALGAIVATDLRLLSKLSQDRIRIAPPNEFVTRIVMLALLVLCLTGAGIVWHGVQTRPDYLLNPKLQAKILFVVLLTCNAFVLHRITFPRLSRGRRVARWHLLDWMLVAVPVAVSNFLWMFCAFLGIARAWNYSTPLRDILEISAGLYLVAQIGVFMILAAAGSNVEPGRPRVTNVLKRTLAKIGSLGTRPDLAGSHSRRSSRSRSPAANATRVSSGEHAPAQPAPVREHERDAADEGTGFARTTASGSLTGRPALRLVDSPAVAAAAPRRRTR
ncbi:MAG: hypothetical protein ABI641_16135 [Caldimonas sp.]